MNVSGSTILITEQPLGYEFTSANTHQLDSTADIEPLLDQMGEVELYI